MCNFNSYKSPQQLSLSGMDIGTVKFNNPYATGFARPEWPVVVLDGGYKNVLMSWSLVPGYISSEEKATEFTRNYATLNAKTEELFEKSTYKEPAAKRRCLVLSSGFYEWRHLSKIGKLGKPLKEKEKFPYSIKVKGSDYFYMGGLWQTYRSNGQEHNTFTICTIPAGEKMSYIHNNKKRQPLILTEEKSAEWLADLSEKEVTAFAHYKFPDDQIEAWTLEKDFFKQEDPKAPFDYHNPELVASL